MRRSILIVTGILSATVLMNGASAPTGLDVVSSPSQDPQTQKPNQVLEVVLSGKDSHPKIGVQDFSGGAAGIAATISEVLWADLDYEREYYMIPRKSSASIPAAATPQALPFQRWAELGADFVLMGSVNQSGANLNVEIRLISSRTDSQGTQAFGQTYSGCTAANARFCAHSIADDMHKRLRNLDGIARTKIAFTSDRASEDAEGRRLPGGGAGKEIYIMDYDGATVRRMTTNKSLNIGPAWGPDGRTLAYSSYLTNYPDVVVLTLDGRPPSHPAQGTDVVANHSPAISPDGTKIAFTSNRAGAGNNDVWVVNRDGSNLTNLTPNTPKSMEGAPTWSPAGNLIAYTSDVTGLNQIFVMEADGTNKRRITFDQQVDRPTWSMLNFIAYTLRQPSGHDIAIMNMSTMTPAVITDGLGSNKQPSVASNGRHILFVTTRWGKEHLATIDRDGKNIRRLTEVGNNTYPSWSPSPGR
jgi:TolB protein